MTPDQRVIARSGRIRESVMKKQYIRNELRFDLENSILNSYIRYGHPMDWDSLERTAP